MDSETAKTVEAVSQAVTGADTPDHVKVTRPTRGTVATLFLALGTVAVGVAVVIALVGWDTHWKPNTERMGLSRIDALKWLGLALCLNVGVLVFAIASPWVGQVSASAGNSKIELLGRKDD